MSYPHKPFQQPRLFPHHPRSKRQQGVVIVVALFIVALVATMAYVMMSRLARDTRRTELIVHDAQAELYAGGSVIWAKDQLHDDWIKQKKDKRVDAVPITSPVNDMNGYSITSTIQDAQGKFNLNNLSKQEWQKGFSRFMHTVYPKVTQTEADEITKATIDWIMPGARDNEFAQYYAGLRVPYSAAHRFMIETGEWRLVKGVTPALYDAMKPYITALPLVTPINPLSAEAPVLTLLGANMTLDAATALHEILVKKPPPTIEAFMALEIIANHPLDKDSTTWISSFFLVETEVVIEHQRILLYTLLQRNNDAKAAVTVLWQNRG
jgi:general secretion pathway protein K